MIDATARVVHLRVVFDAVNHLNPAIAEIFEITIGIPIMEKIKSLPINLGGNAPLLYVK